MELITSRENPRIKQLAALISQKKEREQTGLFVCEGARLCADATEAGLVPEAVYITEDSFSRYPEQVSKLLEIAVDAAMITPEIATRVSDTKQPQGVFAVFKKLDNSEQAVTIRKDGKYLLLAGLQDPGNMGTMLRCAYAMGLDGAFVEDNCPDLYSPKVLRSSMGGALRLPVALVPDMQETIALLRQGGVTVWAAALAPNAATLKRGLIKAPCAVLIGNEGAGLASELIDCCDSAVVIPMREGAESLNAAGAASILMWEIQNSRE